MRKHKYLIPIVMIVVSQMFCYLPVYSAEAVQNTEQEQQDEDFLKHETITESFYIPKSQFMSDYDYDVYCNQMYKNGYMDENHNWTPKASEFINNMTLDNYKALNRDAQDIIEQRIKNGEMKPEDNPFLTGDEVDQIKKGENIVPKYKQDREKEEGSLLDNEYDEETNNLTTEDIADQLITDKDKDELIDDLKGNNNEDNSIENTTKESRSTASNIILISIICVVLGIGYYIYRRQF